MAGVYVHIPFCKKACSYCDFHFSTSFESYRSAMIDAICEEIKQRKDYLKSAEIETIYFGGGTPSLLTEHELNQILATLREQFKVASSIELTLEANPDDINPAVLAVWKKAGINRLSIGVQSFLSADLTWMNRAHSVQEAEEAIRLAKDAGFKLTLDLMYGLPNTSLKEWDYNIQQALELRPEHISAYCLTIEAKTALSKWIQQKKISPVSEEEQAEQFEHLVKQLSAHGYEQYEISNFARDGHYAHHNSNYWKGISYLGVGPSAHSFDGQSRSWNIANNAKYIKKVMQNESFNEREELSPENRFNELILVGLRTKWGCDLTALHAIMPISLNVKNKMEELIQEGLLRQQDQSIYLTEEGKLLADQIAAALFID